MKKLIFISLFISFTINAYSQKVSLDKDYYQYSYRSLPKKPLNRNVYNTYYVRPILKGGMTNNFQPDEIAVRLNLPGFQKVEKKDSADIIYQVTLDDIFINSRNVLENKTETKDKEGNVEVTYRYYIEVEYSYKGGAKLFDSQEKIIDELNLNYNSSFSVKWKSKYFDTSKAASDYYNDNADYLKNSYRSEAASLLLGKFNLWLATNYSYPIIKERSKFYIVSHKKHPETQKYKDISVQIKEAMSLIKAQDSLDSAKQAFSPVIEYLLSLPKNYSAEDKQHQKIRYSAYYNLASIYEVLDDYEKIRQYAQLIQSNDYDASDAKYFFKKADELEKAFQVNNLENRHPQLIE